MSLKNILKQIHKKVTLLSIVIAQLSADDGLPNPSARPITQPKTIDMFVDALYWYTAENIDWAFTTNQNNNSFQTDYKVFNFRWAPGFRVGLGYNMEHDRWDTQASYSWFQSRASSASEGSITPGFFSVRLSALEPFARGHASINLHYNVFDWDLGRSFLVSKHLFLRPFIGMKAGWITQTIHSDWFRFLGSIPIFAREDLKQSFKGGGPKGGVVNKWYLGNTKKHLFSLIGTFEAGYLWGHWSIRDQYEDTLLTTISTNTTPRSFASFMLHSFVGMGWDVNFDRDRSHFECQLGYEIEDWFNQCQLFTDINGAQNNDLILQGFRASVGFDF